MIYPDWTPVLTQLRFPEGPVAREGTVACVDVDEGSVHRIRDGEHECLQIEGRPNGACFDANGSLTIADSGRNAILRLDNATSTLCLVWGNALQGPNDLLVEDSTVTFTDPGSSTVRNRTGRVLRTVRGELEVLADGLAFPNGLVRYNDDDLIVAETKTGRLLLLENQTISVFAEGLCHEDGSGGPDGLALLPNGILAVAVYGAGHLALLDPSARHWATVRTPGKRPTNVCHDGASLYCTEVDTHSLWRCSLSCLEMEA